MHIKFNGIKFHVNYVLLLEITEISMELSERLITQF